MTAEHPFAQFVRTIGRGPNLSRPLNEEEMFEAATMIMEDKVEPLQLGAFLCILRMRTEVAEEGSGFVKAVRAKVNKPAGAPEVDLDWSSYSGKRKQLPYFLLAAIMLANNGIKVAMQGTEGHTEGRLYSREALEFLGVNISASLIEASNDLKATNFCYLPLANFVPKLQEILELKPILGVRSPVNTFARLINPFDAKTEIQTIFHNNYMDVHRGTAMQMGNKSMIVFKGEGGEAERRPSRSVITQMLIDGKPVDETWPAMIDETIEPDEAMDLNRLNAVWDGSDDDSKMAAIVVGTAALALRGMNRAANPEDAVAQAQAMWDARDTSKLLANG